jgi:hypothetical protein
LGERVSGASAKRTFFAASALATRSVEAGSAVVQSITIRPSCAPARMPSSANTHASTSAEDGTHRMRTSLACARAAGLSASVAPRASRSSIGARLRCASTVSS